MAEHHRTNHIVEGLEVAAAEFRIQSNLVKTEDSKEVIKRDAANCQEGAELIKKLDTEVFRLRQSILLFYQGRMDEKELHQIAKTWDGE